MASGTPLDKGFAGKFYYYLRRNLTMSVSVQPARTGGVNYQSTQPVSAAARVLAADLARVARRPYSILLTGETGTGKTHAAREIHQLSVRAGKPFVELNCANLSEHLVEAELFGYRKGAFTGADRDHAGLFEEAQGGILFLDEIGDLTPPVQNKLLKAIEEKRIRRLGTNRFTTCDVQIIAATSRNLPEMVRQGQFRADLYCRLAVLTVKVPSLRERREDIPALLDHFLHEAATTVAAAEKRPVVFRLEPAARALLCAYEYPGNIRALRNVVYELTSYVNGDEPIGDTLAAATLARQANWADCEPAASSVTQQVSAACLLPAHEPGRGLPELAAHDILLPLDLCVLRAGETFPQWTARARQSGLAVACQALGGTRRQAATRLGLTLGSLKGYLRRARALPGESRQRNGGVTV
jgi:DNA-binding NtrC family response regulator